MFRATISQVNMEKVHEIFQTEGFGCVKILELHRKNAEKNQSK
jgi:hypothetical protein